MSFEESHAYRQYVKYTGNQYAVASDCPKHLRRALVQLLTRQKEYDEIKDDTIKRSMTRPGSLNLRKR
jgi:hypothetical protein